MSDEHVPWIQSSFTGDHWQPGCSCGWRGSLTIDIPGAQARNREHLALAASSAVPPTKQDQQREQWGHRCGECRSADGCDAAAQCLAASPVQQEDKQQ